MVSGASWERGLEKTINKNKNKKEIFNHKIQLSVDDCFLGKLYFNWPVYLPTFYLLEDRACMLWTRGLHGNMKWEACELST